VDPENSELIAANSAAAALRAENKPTVPSTIGREIATNPFLRISTLEVCSLCKDPSQQLDILREAKNSFR
jgi:hydroxyacylglutathione hydrolase